MRKFYLTMCLAATFVAAFVSSCSQDETIEQQEKAMAPRATTVKELTAQLRAYNASIAGDMTVMQPLKVRKPGLTKGDAISVGIADAKGAIRGAIRGGVHGAIVGGAVSSLWKFTFILAKKYFFSSKTKASVIAADPSSIAPKIFPTGITPTLNDSVGYYHNMIEAKMYRIDTCSYQRSSSYLVSMANVGMKLISTEYAATGGLSSQQKSAITSDVNTLRNADTEELSFDDYCNLLKSLNPEDSDYIDFAAEYLYIVTYGNVNIDDYTEEVMYLINNSNAGVDDITILNKSIQVAYASMIFSQCTNI